MQDENIKNGTDIPENAFRELKDGEEYVPVMQPDKNYPEVTPYSVSMGLLMAVIFSAAAAYLGLKVGQVFEAAIPIAIIAVGLSGALKKKTRSDKMSSSNPSALPPELSWPVPSSHCRRSTSFKRHTVTKSPSASSKSS